MTGLHIVHRPLAGLPIAVTTLNDAVQTVVEFAARTGGTAADIHLVNAYTVALADSNMDYRACIKGASVNLPDGKPLGWFTWLTKSRLRQVRGPSFFEQVMEAGRAHGLRHYLLGSTPETLGKLKQELGDRFPGVQIVGLESPPFRPMDAVEIREQDARIIEKAPSIVWVGLGTPKQDYEAKRVSASCDCIAIAVGAAFDFVAGTKREAPRWMTNIGVEWIFRFASEPRRLWRRYLIGNLIFLRAMAKRRT
jgi:N-acetylglucosaminyldiphosphoundecaprenol N-acetyl-beta-D-mannosaminyltransferase